MCNSTVINLEEIEISNDPFHHFSRVNLFDNAFARKLLEWLASDLNWEYTETDFYTQYEFSLKDIIVPEDLISVNSNETIDYIRRIFSKVFNVVNLELVDVTIHMLLDGHKMGVHNDFIGGEESHRLVVQLNNGWNESKGGYLMLFNSRDPQDVSKLVQPRHNTAIGFAISPNSYHAVSRVNNFERYTLVYTFKDLGNG
ncbi:hypothetical protein GCM10009120_50120 [Sphingobacterium siyangense subsp. cladoniae]|uniref:cyclophane-containing peptide 2OG-Fe(II) oxygenase YhhC n=1 Tax=Sphingobacterium siyangense TaxID=459529 RepID=UPI0031F9C0CE